MLSHYNRAHRFGTGIPSSLPLYFYHLCVEVFDLDRKLFVLPSKRHISHLVTGNSSCQIHGTYVALNDMLHLPRPSLKERLRSLYMLRLNLGFPYGKTQSSPRPWRAKRTRITWSRTFLGPQFCWPAPSSHADSYFLFFCFH